MTAEQVATLARIGEGVLQEACGALERAIPAPPQPEPPAEKAFPNQIPFDAEKARAWNDRSEKRYAPQYVTRPEDDRCWPKPAVKPPAVPAAGSGEPHSAEVIWALERHINGRVLSPRGQP